MPSDQRLRAVMGGSWRSHIRSGAGRSTDAVGRMSGRFPISHRNRRHHGPRHIRNHSELGGWMSGSSVDHFRTLSDILRGMFGLCRSSAGRQPVEFIGTVRCITIGTDGGIPDGWRYIRLTIFYSAMTGKYGHERSGGMGRNRSDVTDGNRLKFM